MKKSIIISLVAMLSGVATFAATLPEGYYRVQNNGSKRYLYVRDCTGEASIGGTDFGAIELWTEFEQTISDPSSIMYLKNYGGSSWDITSQGTGIHDITGKYINFYYDGKVTQINYSGQYLYEIGDDGGMGILGAKTDAEAKNYGKTAAFKCWLTPKVDSSTDNYFGFKPTVTANGKQYASFYADFAYTPINNNVKTWYVCNVDKEHAIAVVKELTGTVAKSQPVFIECAGAAPSANKVDLTTDTGNAAASNILTGIFFCNGERSGKNNNRKAPAVVEFDSKTMRVLGTNANGELAFVDKSTNLSSVEFKKDGKWITGLCIPHNTSYLTVDADCPASLKVMTESEYNAYIESLKPVVIKGDVNGDGKVSVADIQSVCNIIASSVYDSAADLNEDGKNNVADIQAVCKIIADNK